MNRVVWLDYVRALACLLVVLLHVSAVYVSSQFEWISLEKYYFSWNFSNAVDSVTRICVPLFFMLSGFWFFNEKTPKVKNFTKIIIALIYFSIISMLVINIPFILGKTNTPLVFNIITASAFYHLWFFYAIFMMYFFSLVVNVRKQNFKSVVISIIAIFIIFNPITYKAIETITNKDITPLFIIDGEFVYFFLYAITGALIRNFDFKWNIKKTTMLFIIFIVSSSITAILTKKVSIISGLFSDIFYSYNSPFVFIASVSIFMFFDSIKTHLKESKIIDIISENSLFIYGYHALVLYVIVRLYDFNSISSPVGIIMMFPLVLVISLGLSVITKKIDRFNILS